jgi:hypothetical protein
MTRKLGPHHMMHGNGSERWITEGQPTVAKFVEDFGPGLNAKPGTLLIGRMVDDGLMDGQGFDMNRMCLREKRNPVLTAQWFVRVILEDAIRLNPHIQAWCGPNEQVFEWEQEAERASPALAAANQIKRQQVMKWYAEFLYEFARQIQLRGKRAVLGEWSGCHPRKELNLWPFYTKALQAVRDFNAILSRHEYGALNGEDSLRYRYDNAEFTRLGFPNLPVVISECGGDWVGQSGPWKTYYKTIENYWNTLVKPYALELQKDAYVLGATLYTVGDGNDTHWVPYDVGGTSLIDWAIELNQKTVTTPPPPPAIILPGSTHRVTAAGLNVRQHPWTGEVEPAKLGLLPQGAPVRVFGIFKPDWLAVGWAALTNDSDRWVSLKYLAAL